MNKKLTLIGASVAVSSVLLISSVYAGIGDTPGYDAYKSAFKASMKIQNVTEKVTLSVQDNGAQLLSAISDVKADKASRNVSANIQVTGGGTKELLQVYQQDGKHIIKSGSSDVYQVAGGNPEHQWKSGKMDGTQHEELQQEVENVIDQLTGNLKNYVTLTPQADGTKSIGFQLNGSQIPSSVNAIGSFLVKAGVNGHEHDRGVKSPLDGNLQQLKNTLPKLTQDIKINQVAMNATVDASNYITQQSMKLTLSGKDAAGSSHEVVVSADIGLSDFNKTTPDQVDLSGKQVQTIDKRNPHNE